MAVVEAAKFHGLAVRDDHLVVMDRVHPDRAYVGASVDQRAKSGPGLPERSALTLSFSSATRRTVTPRWRARTSASTTGTLVKLYDSRSSSVFAESMTLTTRCSLPSFGEKATSMVPAAGSVVELVDWYASTA